MLSQMVDNALMQWRQGLKQLGLPGLAGLSWPSHSLYESVAIGKHLRGVVGNKVVAAARVCVAWPSGHSEYLAVVFRTYAGCAQGAPATVAFHHNNSVGHAGHNANAPRFGDADDMYSVTIEPPALTIRAASPRWSAG